jgi:hypothetical protein
MHRLNELVEKLTPSQVKEVEDFAEFLISRRTLRASQGQQPEHKISFEGWAGCLAHVDPEKSNKEIIREAWDAVVDKIDRVEG